MRNWHPIEKKDKREGKKMIRVTVLRLKLNKKMQVNKINKKNN